MCANKAIFAICGEEIGTESLRLGAESLRLGAESLRLGGADGKHR